MHHLILLHFSICFYSNKTRRPSYVTADGKGGLGGIHYGSKYVIAADDLEDRSHRMFLFFLVLFWFLSVSVSAFLPFFSLNLLHFSLVLISIFKSSVYFWILG